MSAPMDVTPNATPPRLRGLGRSDATGQAAVQQLIRARQQAIDLHKCFAGQCMALHQFHREQARLLAQEVGELLARSAADGGQS